VRTAKGAKLGSTRFAIAPGQSKTVRVRLPKSSRHLADGKGHLKVVAVASSGASRHLTLAL